MNAEVLHRTQRYSSPTLQLLQIHGLDISTRQVLHMSEEGIGILLSLRWKPRNEGLKVRIGPRIACKSPETIKRIRILRLS